MAFYNSNMQDELYNLPASDREQIMQSLHSAIADGEARIEIVLNYFREGENLVVFDYQYSELYKVYDRR